MSEIKISFKKKSKKSPENLVIVGHPKLGKTEACSMIPNSLILDLQSGSKFIDAPAADVKHIAMENNISMMDAFYHTVEEIKKNPPDYLIVDTLTALEDLGQELGLALYQNTTMGKNYKDKSILNLPNGGGYHWARLGFEELESMLVGAYKKGTIYIVHPKTASILKEGKDLSARDINLSGKLKTYVCGEADAVGFMYRDKGSNKNIISFKSDERDLATGARPKHLRGQEFIISELMEDGKLKTFWEKIYID